MSLRRDGPDKPSPTVPGWDDGKATWKWLTGGGGPKNFLVTRSDGSVKAVLKL